MANNFLINRIFALSPHIEMIGRRIYWKNVNYLAKLGTRSRLSKQATNNNSANFHRIIASLKSSGVQSGSLIVVHSSYRALKKTGLQPNEIIDALLELISPGGTIAMPGIPFFKNKPVGKESITNATGVKFHYDVQKSKITTGALPKVLMTYEGAIRSRHPINSMVALGPLAKPMMEKNLVGESPLACGVNSSWHFCNENAAMIIGLGIDLTHSLTMIHVAEDVKDNMWPVRNWYRKQRFVITDSDFHQERILRERHPIWGTLHFGERTLCKDLIKAGLLETKVIDEIIVEAIRSKELITFLNKKNHKGYPYFWVKAHLK